MMMQSDRAASIEFSQRALSLGFRRLFFRSIPPLFWTLFYSWCLNALNSRAMLKHCIFATFGRDFELAAVTAFSKKLEKSTFSVQSTVSPEFHINILNCGLPLRIFGCPCRGLAMTQMTRLPNLGPRCKMTCAWTARRELLFVVIVMQVPVEVKDDVKG